MAHEMVSRCQEVGDERGVVLEVDAIDGRVRREARPFDDDELEPVGQRALRRPRPASPDDAPVDEDETLHFRIVYPCNEVGRISAV